ncbi:MAG: putative sugar nucleotidyl transferase, partial [Bacteroidota bacterium]
SEKYPVSVEDDNFILNSTVLPERQICSIIRQLHQNEALLKEGELIAARLDERQFEKLMKDEDIEELQGYELDQTELTKLETITDLFRLNDIALRSDFDLVTGGRISEPLTTSNLVSGTEQIFVEEGAEVECAVINASTGPVYIGKNAKILEGAMLRGPIALCEHSVIKMGAKIYGASTFGPHTKVGGEVSNSVILGYSNKGHEGYLGNSILGEWCNLGADTNVSNLKNNYSTIKRWDYEAEDFIQTDLQFCGLVMGDHSKAGINTMFNTGTVVGVCANIYGGGFPPKFIPSFAWGGSGGFQTHDLEKAFQTAERVMARRNKEFTTEERLLLIKIAEESAKFRT